MTTIEAVSEVIHATGFHTMAREFIDRPDYRERIVAAMTRNISREQGADVGLRFAKLARAALTARE